MRIYELLKLYGIYKRILETASTRPSNIADKLACFVTILRISTKEEILYIVKAPLGLDLNFRVVL